MGREKKVKREKGMSMLKKRMGMAAIGFCFLIVIAGNLYGQEPKFRVAVFKDKRAGEIEGVEETVKEEKERPKAKAGAKKKVNVLNRFKLQDTISPNYPNDFDVYDNGNRTIIADYYGKILLYNSADKTNLQLIDDIAVRGAHDVRVIDGDNNYAYYVGWAKRGAPATFGILNLTNERAITIQDSVDLTHAFYCRAYNISGRLIVFVVTYRSNGLHIYDVTDHKITLLDSIKGSGDNYDIREAWRVMYHPDYKLAIVGAYTDGTGCTSVFDASNLSNITPIVKYTGAQWKWSNLYIEENKVYGEASDQDSVEVATINAEGTLTWLGNYQSAEYLDNAHGIYVENDIIYAVSWFNDGITILDATDPTNITYVTGIYASYLDSRHAIEKSGDYIFTAGAHKPGVFTVHKYDASLLASPALQSKQRRKK